MDEINITLLSLIFLTQIISSYKIIRLETKVNIMQELFTKMINIRERKT